MCGHKGKSDGVITASEKVNGFIIKVNGENIDKNNKSKLMGFGGWIS